MRIVSAAHIALVASLSCAFGATSAPRTNGGGGIRELLNRRGMVSLGTPCGVVEPTSAAQFYKNNFTAVWTRNGAVTPQASEVVNALKDAASKGLPDRYDAALWDERLKSVQADAAKEVARFDVALTACALQYASDLRFGLLRTAPSKNDERQFPAWLRSNLPDAPDAAKVLAGLEPPLPAYQRSLKALQDYRGLAGKEDPKDRIPALRKVVKPGVHWAGVPQLGRRLRLLGDLTADPPPGNVYQEPLVAAVSHFQQRHGINADGQIGPATVAALNVPIARRIRQLELTLERWREAPRVFSHPPVIVNIPEFVLRTLDPNYHVELQMKVVTGGAYGHQTPIFSSEMKYLIFRPYWDVPASITRQEIIPHMEKNHEYLAKNHYQIVDSAEHVIEPRALTADIFHKLRSGVYRIRQEPGPDNALGGVKFMFPNAHNVYLHGTPAVELFSKTRRDVSHGCIRLEKPADLAAWALRGQQDWTPERIEAAMNGDKPQRVELAQPIPVLIVYGTALVTEDGTVHFFQDIYKLDTKLEAELAAKKLT